MRRLFSALYYRFSNEDAGERILPAYNDEDEILRNLKNNVKNFTINLAEVDLSHYSRKYIKPLFDAIDRSESVQRLVIRGTFDYFVIDWQLVVSRVINNSNITELSLSMGHFTGTSFEVANLIAKSKSITKLEIFFPLVDSTDQDSLRSGFKLLSDSINNSTSINSIKISHLRSNWHPKPETIQPLIEALCNNQIRTLEINDYSNNNLECIVSQLHQSSITDLILSNATEYNNSVAKLAELITKNRNIKRLSMLSVVTDDQTVGQLVDAIKNSKSLKYLAFINMYLGDAYIGDIIAHNTSLESLMWSSALTFEVDLEKISDGLKKNSTLTRLDMQGKKISDRGYIRLGEAMKVNSTLKKLHSSHNDRQSNADATPLFNGLKFNTGLNVLTITGHISGVWYHTNEIMKTNRALIDIIPREYEGETKPHPQLILNKQSQDEVVLGGKSLVRAIYWHTNSFLTLLPLELWYAILSHVRHPGVAIDFELALKELFRRKNDSNNVMS